MNINPAWVIPYTLLIALLIGLLVLPKDDDFSVGALSAVALVFTISFILCLLGTAAGLIT